MKLIGYLSNGFPSIQASSKMAEEYADAGIDIIEIDFPSSNPYLESELIAGRMAKALERCSDFDQYMEEMISIRAKLPQIEFILLAYENTVEEIGVAKFIEFCKKNGFVDIILVGLKDESIKRQLIQDGLKVSCYVQFHMDQDEIESAKASNGFVYLQAKPAPGMANPKFPILKDCVDGLREMGVKEKIYCGVGIHQPEDVEMAREAGADAVFVGSSILRLHNDLPAMKAMIVKLKEKC